MTPQEQRDAVAAIERRFQRRIDRVIDEAGFPCDRLANAVKRLVDARNVEIDAFNANVQHRRELAAAPRLIKRAFAQTPVAEDRRR